MVEKSQEDGRWRADAAVVYRSLRDAGPASALTLSERCFPVAVDGPASSLKLLQKRSWRRVIDSIVWMRHQGVALSAVPSEEGAVFHLGVVAGTVSPLRVTEKTDDLWHQEGSVTR